MSFFGSLFGAKKSAVLARDRLKITLARERAGGAFDFVDRMKEEIISVVKKYVPAGDIRILAKKNQNIDRLDIEIDLEPNA
jgi:cell division topological specificity factor MinE